MGLRAQRRDRAFRRGAELFLYNRGFDDCLDRLAMVRRRFASAFLIGCPNPEWTRKLAEFANQVAVLDPGACFARAAAGSQIIEDELQAEPGKHDLCVAVGTLDSVNDLPGALLRIRLALRADGLLLGALAGGETLPQLRAAMRAADGVQGFAAPHVHPRIEPSALAGLLSAAGFANPVVDVDRVRVSYRSLSCLVDDLRSMGATNILSERSDRRLSKLALRAAQDAFADAATEGRTVETFEILHFAGWTAGNDRTEMSAR
jgi:hypothetical protein